LLAGKPEQALPLLQMAANDCEVQRSPIAITRASYLLGLAHEAKGEKAAACAAYGKVIARWGKARPRSVTARAAKEHARVLGCGPT
jgi:serine/threonine-protein kinase